VQSQLAVMGDMSLGGTIVQVRNLAESMQVAFDAGAKRILLPMSSVTDIPSVPGELFAKFQTSFLFGSGGCGVQGAGGGVGQRCSILTKSPGKRVPDAWTAIPAYRQLPHDRPWRRWAHSRHIRLSSASTSL
jgi:hypothetical protein